MRIDAHQHFWLMKNRAATDWPPPELSHIRRDFHPADLEPLLRAASIEGTVAVQSLPNEQDTDYLLDLADRTCFMLGVVGWTDLMAADAPSKIAALAARPKLKGVRAMLQDTPDPDWIADPALDPAMQALKSAGLALDLLALPPHFPALSTFLPRHTELRMVIDHGAKPLIASGHFVDWRRAMAGFAAHPNVHCKLSGLWTEAGDQKHEAIRPYAETLLELFGADRLIWGSDWPVVEMSGSYQAWLDQCMDIVPAADHAKVFGGNAAKFYRLATAEAAKGNA